MINKSKIMTDRVNSELNSEGFKDKIFFEKKVDSTNDFLKKKAENYPQGTTIVAKTQKNGRGRFSRKWLSPEGGLWFSTLLKPESGFRKPGPLTVLIGTKLASCLGKFTNLPIKTKWPNDLYLYGKKLGGILLESRMKGGIFKWIVAGIGINVNNETTDYPVTIRNTSVSLLEVKGAKFDLLKVLTIALNSVEDAYEKWLKNDLSLLEDHWKETSRLYGKSILFKVDGSVKKGTVLGLNKSAELTLKAEHSIKSFRSENIEIVKIYR